MSVRKETNAKELVIKSAYPLSHPSIDANNHVSVVAVSPLHVLQHYLLLLLLALNTETIVKKIQKVRYEFPAPAYAC